MLMRKILTPEPWLLSVLSICLAACSTAGTFQAPASNPRNSPAAYTHRVGTADVEIYWNCSRPAPNVLEMDGMVQNVGGRTVHFMELNLVGVDSRGDTVTQATASVPDTALWINQTSRFHMQLQAVGSEVRFDLYYKFYPGGPRFGFAHREYVWDACSPTQHLAR